MTDKEKTMETLAKLGAKEKTKILGDNLVTIFTVGACQFQYSSKCRRWMVKTPSETITYLQSSSVLALLDMAEKNAQQGGNENV